MGNVDNLTQGQITEGVKQVMRAARKHEIARNEGPSL